MIDRYAEELEGLQHQDPRLKAFRERLRSDFRFFCARMLKIKPKSDITTEDTIGPLIPFVWNEAQETVWLVMVDMLSSGLPLELIILKARQLGISTLFCAWIFWQMWRQMHVKAAIVAFRKDTTLKELNQTMQTFYLSLPDGFRPQLRQQRKNGRISKDEVFFADRESENMFVVQAPDALRGVARDIVLCTEVSFYKEAEEFFGGFTPSLSRGRNRCLVKESSPADGYFREEYESARDGKSTRRALFLAWWWVASLYSRPLERRGRKLLDAITGEVVRFMPSERKEQETLSRMARKHGRPPITDEQMYWRQHEIDTQFGGDEEFFNQEYPRDDVSAFERATSSVFKMALPLVRKTSEETLDLYPETRFVTLASRTYLQCGAEQVIDVLEEPKPNWIDQERRPGLLLIREPKAGYTYTIGADVASEGDEDEEQERAFSTACVFCCNTREQVAEWRGHIDPHDLGDELVKLGYWYNNAMICVERNNMGVTTEDRIKRILMYPIRFRWPDFNTGIGALTKKEMWETNKRTKQLMIGVLRQWLRDGLFIVRSPGLAFELANYVLKNGSYKPSGHAYADRIIAAALAIQCVEQTEFAYKAVVMGANGDIPERGAAGAASRFIKQGRLPRELPEELNELHDLRIDDLWRAAAV